MCLLPCQSAVAVSWCGDTKMAGTGARLTLTTSHELYGGLVLQAFQSMSVCVCVCVWFYVFVGVYVSFRVCRSERDRIRRIWMRGWKNWGVLFFWFSEKYLRKEVDLLWTDFFFFFSPGFSSPGTSQKEKKKKKKKGVDFPAARRARGAFRGRDEKTEEKKRAGNVDDLLISVPWKVRRKTINDSTRCLFAPRNQILAEVLTFLFSSNFPLFEYSLYTNYSLDWELEKKKQKNKKKNPQTNP